MISDTQARTAAIVMGGNDRAARALAYRRFRLLVEPHDGGWLGNSQAWHERNSWTRLTRGDLSDLMSCTIEAEYRAVSALEQQRIAAE